MIVGDVIEIDDPILLARFRTAMVRKTAVEINPRAYDADETDARVMEHQAAWTAVCERYDVQTEREYTIDAVRGRIYYDA